MKKLTFICLIVFVCSVFSFANERNTLSQKNNTQNYSFVGACNNANQIHLMKKDKDGGDHKAYKKLAPHEKTFLWTAVGLTIGFGVAIIAGPVTLGVTTWVWATNPAALGYDWYALWGLQALGGLLVSAAVLLFMGAVAMWVLYAIVQHGKKEGYCMFKNVNTFECATAEGDGAQFGFKIAL